MIEEDKFLIKKNSEKIQFIYEAQFTKIEY